MRYLWNTCCFWTVGGKSCLFPNELRIPRPGPVYWAGSLHIQVAPSETERHSRFFVTQATILLLEIRHSLSPLSWWRCQGRCVWAAPLSAALRELCAVEQSIIKQDVRTVRRRHLQGRALPWWCRQRSGNERVSCWHGGQAEFLQSSLWLTASEEAKSKRWHIQDEQRIRSAAWIQAEPGGWVSSSWPSLACCGWRVWRAPLELLLCTSGPETGAAPGSLFPEPPPSSSLGVEQESRSPPATHRHPEGGPVCQQTAHARHSAVSKL